MNAALVAALARHIGSMIAGVLITLGVVGSGDTELVIGAVTAIGTLGGAIYAKVKK